METKPNVIVCAAVRTKDGKIIAGVRHFDNIMRQHIGVAFHPEWDWEDPGFIDKFGKFLNREEAWKIADDAGQIKYRVGGDWNNKTGTGTLFSENLY